MPSSAAPVPAASIDQDRACTCPYGGIGWHRDDCEVPEWRGRGKPADCSIFDKAAAGATRQSEQQPDQAAGAASPGAGRHTVFKDDGRTQPIVGCPSDGEDPHGA